MICPRDGISFPCVPNRANFFSPVRITPSTGSAPKPLGRLESRKRSLLGTDSYHVVLVALKEPRTRTRKMGSGIVSAGSSKAGSQRDGA